MGLALIAFLAIFMLIGSAGLLFFFRAGMTQRLSSAITPDADHSGLWTKLKESSPGDSIKAVIQPFDKVLPKSPKEVSIIQQRLIRAGFREDSHVRIFYGAKVIVPLTLCLVVAVTGLSNILSPFFAYVLALGLGYLLPDFWLGRRVKSREENIRVGLPEFLDLLVVCVEAGLSLDQGLNRATEEMRVSQPQLTDEMGLVILEQRAGRPRVDAWRNLAERVSIDVIRTLVGSIVQADQFGTSIGKTLRIYSETLRVQRRQKVEEKAAKTPVKLVFPLVLFIFPSLFVVTLGPAMIVMAEAFAKYFK